MEIDLNKLKIMLDWHIKCDGRKPVLHLRDDDAISHKFLECETNRWNNRDDDAYVAPAAVENFMQQFIDCLAQIESRDRIVLMKRIQTLGGYGYRSGGVTGKNEYTKNKSRVDGSMYQTKRR
jgi:hypothetical protein|tara:strand:+ start:687 stop:1052 length:366 start_codon:yes stop_codon:yes gene_type:complete